MLLNEFLKEHRKNEEQQATILRAQEQITTLQQELKEQKTLIEKVNARIDKAAPQLIVDKL
jgi:hypothetical protein